MVPRVALLFFSFFLCSSAWSASTWSAELGWPAVVPGYWTPLVVEVPADAGAWKLEVRPITGSGRSSGPVVYAKPAGGRYELPVFLDDATRSLELKFLSGGLVMRAWNLDLRTRLFPGHLVGTLGLGAGTRAQLAEVLLPQEPVRVLTLAPALWPTSPLSYGGLSALVVRDPGAVLAPAQAHALKTWVATGGRLVIVAPRQSPASLLAQFGDEDGVVVVTGETPPRPWRELLSLAPFGEVRRWGTDFEPPAVHPPQKGSSIGSGLLVVGGWAGLGALLLALRRKGGPGWPLAWGLMGSAVVVAVVLGGGLDWDRGLPVHAREVVMPGLGRFRSVEAVRDPGRSSFLDWPTASPWALEPWLASRGDTNEVARLVTHHRVVFESFVEEENREGGAQMRWEGGLRWLGLEEAPRELGPDLPWLTRLAASSPGTVWTVGLDGDTCWVRPER